jgi:hypothetical protein
MLANWFVILLLILVIYIIGHFLLSALTRLLFVFLRSRDTVVKGLAILLLPGTFIHEVAHLVFAEFLRVPTDGLTVVPEIKSSREVKLGGVKVAQTDPLRRTIIGLAPVFLGLIIIWVFSTFFWQTVIVHYPQRTVWIVTAIYFYSLLQIGVTMFSSAKDLEGSVAGIILAGLLLWFLKFLGEIIVFEPLTQAKNLLVIFLNNNLPYLRLGLICCFATLVVVLAVTKIILLAVKKR